MNSVLLALITRNIWVNCSWLWLISWFKLSWIYNIFVCVSYWDSFNLSKLKATICFIWLYSITLCPHIITTLQKSKGLSFRAAVKNKKDWLQGVVQSWIFWSSLFMKKYQLALELLRFTCALTLMEKCSECFFSP